jgi:hypothetical protein
MQEIYKGLVANDKTGTPARTAAQIINDNFTYLDNKITRKDGIVESTGMVESGQDKTLNLYWRWIIDTIDYTNPATVLLNFPYAAAGKMRLDIVALTTSNTAIRIAGPESDSNPATPTLPDNMIEAGLVLVTDSMVGDVTPPVIGDSYVLKRESQDFIANYGATTIIDHIDLTDDRSSISLIGSATDVKSVNLSGLYIRPGKPHFFKNRTGHDVKIWHLAGTGNIKYFFPNGLDLIVKPNEVIQFNTNANDSSVVRFEYVGNYADLTNYYTKTETDTADTNTLNSAKSYADGLVVGLLDDRGNYNPTTNSNLYPTTGGSGASGAILKGDLWSINGLGSGVSATIGTKTVTDGDVIRALVNTPSNTDANWVITENNFGYVAENSANKSNDIETDKTSTSKYASVKQLYDWAVAKFQAILVSGTNIKTINSSSILGSGNLNTPDMDTTTAQDVLGVKTFRDSKFALRNVANTFSITFTNAITAARSVTWPDKNGTVAYTSDIVDKLSGTANYLVKFGTATTGILSRLFDNGTYFGIGTNKTPLKDITLGNQNNKEIGIEESSNIVQGRNLRIVAGRTINYIENAIFNFIGTIPVAFYGMCSTPSGNVYGVNGTNKLYKQTGGSGAFVDTGITLPINATNICSNSSNDLYISANGTDIYKQTNETGSFVATGSGSRNWAGHCSLGTVIYASVNGGDIYKQTGGTGAFAALSQTTRAWGRMYASSANVYVCVAGGGIYRQTAGTGNFTQHTTSSSSGIVVSSANDIFINIGTDIYKQTNETGTFNPTGSSVTSGSIWGMAAHANGNIYAGDWNGYCYVLQNNGSGTADLNGGNLDLVTGTGKGTGINKLRFWTGQKTVSGTDMQVETLRGYFDENGYFVCLYIPTYSNDAAADADSNLPSGAYYKLTGNRTTFQKP